MPFKPVEHPKCPKCGKSVYAAEEMNAGGYKWHKFCFKCALCNKLLDSTNCCEHQAELYCKQCHGRKYGPKGIGFGIGAGALTMDTGEHFELCNKLLDSTNVAPHEAELYCKQCHGRKFGPKGVGFGLGAGALTMDDGSRFASK
ncbi:LIM protein [Dirofilaria immitis]|nr:LIM protein [Dirofilaria immitis]